MNNLEGFGVLGIRTFERQLLKSLKVFLWNQNPSPFGLFLPALEHLFIKKVTSFGVPFFYNFTHYGKNSL